MGQESFFSSFETESRSVSQVGSQSSELRSLPRSSDSPASASQVTGTTDKLGQLTRTTIPNKFCVFIVETGFHHIGQVGLELLNL